MTAALCATCAIGLILAALILVSCAMLSSRISRRLGE